MGRSSEAWGNLADAANECEQSVWEALQRARQGQATDADWELINWACGFSNPTPRTKTAFEIDTSELPF